MSAYASFFLNSRQDVVQLETIEIIHNSFTKVYRIVRNAINGITVTLEDATVATFDYYPIKIVPNGSAQDLDQTLEITFGDLGDILPLELDRVVSRKSQLVYPAALLGVFTDTAGNIVAPPFFIGNGLAGVYVPLNATKLSMGMNDNAFGDNVGGVSVVINGSAPVSVIAFSRPWEYDLGGAGRNPKYKFDSNPSNTPSVVTVTPGTQLFITVSGVWKLTSGGPSIPPTGDTTLAAATGNPTDAGFPGENVPLEPAPGTFFKPKVIYRTFRSDDLSQPLFGPDRFEANSVAFNKDGATFNCTAPRLNLSATGEIYTMDRFPMLRGFL